MKYHKREIEKGTLGELSKIREEMEEAIDAEEQSQPLMLLIELADMLGAIEAVSLKYNLTLENLIDYYRLRDKVREYRKKQYNEEKKKSS